MNMDTILHHQVKYLKNTVKLITIVTVCKTCLVKHLEDENTCPTCQIVIHQSHPLNYITFDRTMQDIVYKLVPGLEESKNKRLIVYMIHTSKTIEKRVHRIDVLQIYIDLLKRLFFHRRN